ncbi:MAG TPA: beta-1,6-glucan synthase [Methyloceanibacter sp.]|nr:beta-1,6-glucan synthase [Methyloceanibacter sp.]
MVRSLILFALVAGAIAAVWHGLGKPHPVPPFPVGPDEKVTCISYAPFHAGQAPFTVGLVIPDSQIEGDLKQLARAASCVRTYSAMGRQGAVARLAAKHGLEVLQGIWLGRNRADNRREIEAALKLAKAYPGTIKALIVGNEALLRGELLAGDVRVYLEEVRQRSDLPSTYADVWEFWLEHPELASATDFVTIHVLPYWENDPVAAEKIGVHLRDVMRRVGEAFPGKEILIGEIGWPSAGRMREAALPSPSNQALVVSEVVAAAKEQGWRVNIIEAYDQHWKRLLEGTVGGHWGLFDDTTRELKFRFGEPVSNHPDWMLKAGLGIGAAALVFMSFGLGARGREARGWRRDPGAASIALATGLTFGLAATNLAMENALPGEGLRGVIMFALALTVPMAAAFALARGWELPGFAMALDPPHCRGGTRDGAILAALLVATAIAAIHVALGLVFDPRYKDFPFAALTGPVTALAVAAFIGARGRLSPGAAEIAAASVLAGSALFIVGNEGAANWQADWLALLFVALALTVLQARTAPG